VRERKGRRSCPPGGSWPRRDLGAAAYRGRELRPPPPTTRSSGRHLPRLGASHPATGSSGGELGPPPPAARSSASRTRELGPPPPAVRSSASRAWELRLPPLAVRKRQQRRWGAGSGHGSGRHTPDPTATPRP
jgi:hypothetical protein